MSEQEHHEEGEPRGGDRQAIEEIDALRAERDDFEQKWLRTAADLQNFRRRAAQSEVEARRQGVTSVLHSLLPVLDHFDMALSAACGSSAEQLLAGVRSIRAELIRTLSVNGVGLIEPGVGEEFDPSRHEAIAQQPAEGVEAGRVSGVMQAGYTLEGRVVRPAKVTVAPSDAGGGVGGWGS